MKTSKKSFLLILVILAVAVLAIFLNSFVSASKTIAYGCFHQVAHKGSGCAALVRKSNGQTHLQLIDFKTTENEDLQILLISATDALENETVKNSERIFVAPLEKSEGFQEFVLPFGQDIKNFHSVVIWNNKHGVNFTTAPLEKIRDFGILTADD